MARVHTLISWDAEARVNATSAGGILKIVCSSLATLFIQAKNALPSTYFVCSHSYSFPICSYCQRCYFHRYHWALRAVELELYYYAAVLEERLRQRQLLSCCDENELHQR